jgi:hypothetical protein
MPATRVGIRIGTSMIRNLEEVAGKHLLAATDFVSRIILRIFKGSVLIHVEK